MVIRMSDIGERLKEERERLKLSQPALGERCGVKKLAQFNYEKGERAPDALYLVGLAASGGDVMYVLTGRRGSIPLAPVLAPDESVLIGHYRASPPELRKAALRVLLGGSAPAKAPSKKISATVTQSGDGNVFHQTQGDGNDSSTSGGKRKR
jgi:transcriptional regulator with XRE-family HTH domain